MIDKREITPELLARVTVAIFTNVRFRDVLENKIRYDRLKAEDIAHLMMQDEYFRKARSEDECKSLAHSVIDYVVKQSCWKNIGYPQSGTKYIKGYGAEALNVFDLFLLTLQDLLVMNRNRLESKYEEIFAWRLFVRHLGEEVALSARQAQWDHEHNRDIRQRYDEFAWPYVTGHNNKQLNMLLQRGVSDHHCHLMGSTPYFHVSWINLMNEIENSSYQDRLREIDHRRWSAENDQEYRRKKNVDDPLDHYGELARMRAAWIRLYLCERVLKKTDAHRRYYDMENVRSYNNWRLLLRSQGRLQSELDSYIKQFGNTGDYALSMASLQGSIFSTDYHILIGERWLYYRIFRDYVLPQNQRSLTEDDYYLFFLYLLIRRWLREKLVQTNENIGFENFQRIERRKSSFLRMKDREENRVLTRLTINESLRKEFMKELEVRLSPDERLIGELDGYVQSNGQDDNVDRYLAASAARTGALSSDTSSEKNLKDRYYYVFHFLKRRDPSQEADEYDAVDNLKSGLICRHSAQRQNYMKQAKMIIHFREENPELAKRVLGIDSASREIGCRPEVFSSVYRLLGDHQHPYGGRLKSREKLPALGKTYHVAEDYSDIVDGLRAIDEAIHFLDFDCGDRLGHAMALGINVEEWYQQKHQEISLSVQDYLDNLAWLYHALNHLDIPGLGGLKERIIQDFDYWFRVIYQSNVNDADLWTRMEHAQEYYRFTGEDHRKYKPHSCSFNIRAYYHAWTLRGDDPECYIDGFFKKAIGGTKYCPEERCKICQNFPKRFDDRYVPEYSLLNYLYQFNYQIRRNGAQRIKIDISLDYIRAVKEVQRAMRQRIARSGISIETNPTSNVMIGTFRKYEKHPILAFFNRGLPVNQEENESCAQIQVSINTDDRGTFYTDIETEYALLARSVEQLRDSQDVSRFTKQDIYTWLDHIRVMGLDQSFRQYDGES